MVNIDLSGNITMNRGDSVSVPLFINLGDKLMPIRYPFSAEDEVYVGITEPNQPWEFALIKKKYTAEELNEKGDIVLSLNPEETEHVLPGYYFYEVKLRHTEPIEDSEEVKETVYTVVPKRQFIILE